MVGAAKLEYIRCGLLAAFEFVNGVSARNAPEGCGVRRLGVGDAGGLVR